MGMPKFLFLLTILLGLASCGHFKKEEEEKPKERLSAVVGEITSVHPEQGFVLFRRYGPGQLLEGGLLSSRSLDGRRAAHLTLSPEKLGRFYTADFSKEVAPPRVGDVVLRSKLQDDTQSEPLAEKTSERGFIESHKKIASEE